jgi:hypothetical protein
MVVRVGLPYRIAHMYALEIEKGIYMGSVDQRDQL